MTLTATFFSNPSSPLRRHSQTSDIPPEAIFRRSSYLPSRSGATPLLLPAAFRGDPELSHLPVDARPVDPQLLGGAAHVVVVLLELALKVFALEGEDRLPEIVQREGRAGRGRREFRPGDRHREDAQDRLLLDPLPHREDHEALHHVPEFPDVSRPRMREDALDGLAGELLPLLAKLHADLRGEVGRDRRDVVPAVAERRD